MPADTELPSVDDAVKEFTSTEKWKEADMNKRRDYVRKFVVAGKASGAPDDFHGQVADKLYEEAGSRGFLGWVGNAVKEGLWSIPASIGAASIGAADTAGLTDSGSGTRFAAGVRKIPNTLAQRAKQLHPDDEQEKRDRVMELFKKEIDDGNVPESVKGYLTRDEQTLDEYREADEYLGKWKDLIFKQTVAADTGRDSIDVKSSQTASGRSVYDPRADELLADYMATRDPSSWDALQNLATETEVQWKNRVRTAATEGANMEEFLRKRAADEKRELSMGEELAIRSMGFQQSPIDIALSVIPLVKGVTALKAAKAGKTGQALKDVAVGTASEAASGALSSFTEDPRNTAGEIAESAAMEAVGGLAITGSMAGAGRALRKAIPEAPEKPDEAPPVDPTTAPVASEEVSPDSVAQSLLDSQEDAGLVAQDIAEAAPQTASALAQIADKTLPQQPSEQTELGAGAATEPPEASLQVTTPAGEEIIQPGDSADLISSPTATDVQTGLGIEPGNVSPEPLTITDETQQTPAVETQGLQTGAETGSQPGVVEESPIEATSPAVPVSGDVTFATETESPRGEPVPTSGESSLSTGLNSPGAPGLQAPDADVGQVDSIEELPKSGKVKSRSVLPKPPKELSAASKTAHTELESIVSDFLPAFSQVFSGVEIVESLPGVKTGGFYYRPSNGKLGISMSDVAANLSSQSGRVKDKKRWAVAAIAEEAIHAVAHKLEKQGKLDSVGLLSALKRDARPVYNNFRKAYRTATERDAANEFIRMLVQGRVKFEAGGVTIDGEFTEMQYTDRIIKVLKKILEQLQRVIRDLRGKLPKELANELDSAGNLLADNLQALVEQGKKEEAKRPADEEFVWTAEDDVSGTQSPDQFITRFTKLPGKQADGEGGFMDVYNVVGGPADGTTFMVPEGASETEVQQAANDKTKQFLGVVPSQSPDDMARGQEMGVPELGGERPVESRDPIRNAIRENIFNAQTADVNSVDDYQTAHDLARQVVDGSTASLDALMKQAGVDTDTVAFAATLYGELMRFAARMAIENTDGRQAEFSFLTTLADGYGSLPEATMKMIAGQDESDTTAVTKIARLLGSLKEVSEPFGAYLKWHAGNIALGNAELKKKGWTDAEIKAVNDFATRPPKTEEGKAEAGKALDQSLTEAESRHAPVDAALATVQERAKKKRKPVEETQETSDQEAQEETEAAIEQDVDNTLENRARKLMARFATEDTWSPDRTPQEKSELEKLVLQHVKAPVVNFTEQAEQLGLDMETAAQLERAVSSTRDSRDAVRKYRQTNPPDKAKDQAIERLMTRFGPRAKKPAAVRDIVEALAEYPEFANDPVWRKAVVKGWLIRMGVDTSRMKLDQLDTLIATVFADARTRMLKDFLGRKMEKKVQPTEVEKIAKAIKTGMVTGTPIEWQSAFTEKFGMRALTPEEMQQVLKYSAIIDPESGFNRHDRIVAHGKLATIFRRAGGKPGIMALLAASYTTSALTGLSTQTLQFTSAATNWASRIYEDLLSGGLTGKGIAPVMNGIQSAFETYKRSFASALKNDNYRTAQLDEIQKLSVLKTALEDAIREFKDAGMLRRAALLPKIAVGAQDFFRRLMSSADDAGVSGLASYISSVEGQKLLREAGVTQGQINKMFDVAKEHLASLSTDSEWKKNRPDYSKSNYMSWAMDESHRMLMDSMQSTLAERMALRGMSPADAQSAISEIDDYSSREAQFDVGVGADRDPGSKWDVLQLVGEWIVSGVEKSLRLNPKDKDANAALKYMLARMLFGFVRTPFNVMSRSVYRGPLGLYRLAVTGALMPGKFSERAATLYQRSMGTARQQAQRRREALVWTLTVASLYALSKGLSGKDDDTEDDVLIINGQGPSDEQAKNAWRAAGHQPNSIEFNVGGGRITLPFGRSGLESLKPSLMLLSTLNDMRHNGLSGAKPESLLEYAKLYANSTIYNASLFGFRNIAQWRQDTSGPNQFTKRVAYSLSPLIPFSGFTKSIGKLISPEKPDDKTFKGAIAMSTPLFFIGEKAYNIYGAPVYGSPSSTTGELTNRLMYAIGLPFSVDLGKPDKETLDAYAFSLKTGRAPSAPSREDIDRRLTKADPKHVPMSDAQWVRYWRAAGKERLDAMKEFAPRGTGMNDRLIERNLEVINRRAHNAGVRALRN